MKHALHYGARRKREKKKEKEEKEENTQKDKKLTRNGENCT